MTSVTHSGSIEDLFHLGYPAIISSNVFFFFQILNFFVLLVMLVRILHE